MKTKICFKCGVDQSLDDFYAHPQMGDGHLNKCKECTKIDSINRYSEKRSDPEWMLSEKERTRDRYHRLGYKSKTQNYANKKKIMSAYFEKYPEKRRAQSATSKFKTPDGMHKHHWSYREEHIKDFIIIESAKHQRAHCFMIYDQERMMYRTLSGELMDTKLKHLNYMDSLNLSL